MVFINPLTRTACGVCLVPPIMTFATPPLHRMTTLRPPPDSSRVSPRNESSTDSPLTRLFTLSLHLTVILHCVHLRTAVLLLLSNSTVACCFPYVTVLMYIHVHVCVLYNVCLSAVLRENANVYQCIYKYIGDSDIGLCLSLCCVH